MGYHTDYTLSYTGNDFNFDLAIDMMGEPVDVVHRVARKNYLFYGEKVSQAEMDEAMLLVSTKYPGITFKVHAEGAEQGDVSDHYYVDGKKASYTLPVPEMPTFNPADLK